MRSMIAPPRTSKPSSGDEAALGRCTVRTLPARRLKVSAPRARPARRRTDGGGGAGETCRATARCVGGAEATAVWRVGVAAGWAGGGEEDAVCGCEVEATWVTTVAAGFGAACGAGSGAGPRGCGGAGSGPAPAAGAAKVAKTARHAARTSARRAPIRSQLHDPRSSTFPPQAVNGMLPDLGSCVKRRDFRLRVAAATAHVGTSCSRTKSRGSRGRRGRTASRAAASRGCSSGAGRTARPRLPGERRERAGARMNRDATAAKPAPFGLRSGSTSPNVLRPIRHRPWERLPAGESSVRSNVRSVASLSRQKAQFRNGFQTVILRVAGYLILKFFVIAALQLRASRCEPPPAQPSRGRQGSTRRSPPQRPARPP